MAFCVSIGCVRFGRNCGKMYNRHLFLYGGLEIRGRSYLIVNDWKKNKIKNTLLSSSYSGECELTGSTV